MNWSIQAEPASLLPELAAAVGELQPVSMRAARWRAEQPGFLLLVARDAEDQIMGFKAGYDRYADGSWYSWLGGVLVNARGTGVASALMTTQEQWVVANGYKRIVVKTRNKFVGMRVLLAKSGYNIVEVSKPDQDAWDDARLIHIKEFAYQS